MSCGATCVGCRKPQIGDWQVDAMIHELCDLTKPTPSAAEVASVVERLDAAERDDRVVRFDPIRKQRPDIIPELAMHEGGHAVVGITLGLKVKSVNISTTVCCEFHRLPRIASRERIIMLLAGHAVAQRFQRIRTRPSSVAFCAAQARHPESQGNCDTCLSFRQLAKALPDAADGERIEVFHELEDEAIAMVRRPAIWRAVEAVAAALVEHGHLDGDEVERIVAEAIGTPETLTRFSPGGPGPRGTRDGDYSAYSENPKPHFPFMTRAEKPKHEGSAGGKRGTRPRRRARERRCA